jgi:cyclohexanone monooxygenase
MHHRGVDTVEATAQAEQDWVQHVNARADATLYPKARSYYMGDDVPGKPRVFMPYSGGVRGYRRILERVVADGYEGLTMSRSCEHSPGRR